MYHFSYFKILYTPLSRLLMLLIDLEEKSAEEKNLNAMQS